MTPIAGTAQPLTEAQLGLWYAARLDRANPLFNTAQYAEIAGPLDIERFRQAVDTTMAEAEALALRVLETDGEPRQEIDPAWSPRLRIVDLGGHEEAFAAALAAIVMIALIEIVRWVRAMALADPHRPVNEPVAAGTPAGRVLVTVISLILTVFGLAAAGLGLLVLLDRYDTTSPEEVLVTSLVGAGIALFGLLVVAVAGGLRRGSRFSRWLVTGYLGILAALNLAVTVIDRDWTWSSTGSIVLAVAFIVVLWVRPAAGVFRDGE